MHTITHILNPMKNKKVFALYLTVAFFFMFSFGIKSAFALTVSLPFTDSHGTYTDAIASIRDGVGDIVYYNSTASMCGNAGCGSYAPIGTTGKVQQYLESGIYDAIQFNPPGSSTGASDAIMYHCSTSYTGCTYYASGSLYLNGYPTVTIDFSSRDILSTGSSVVVTGTGGAPLYTGTQIVSWSPIATSTPTTSPQTISITYFTDTDLGSSTPQMTIGLNNYDIGKNIVLNLGLIATSTGTHTITSAPQTLQDGLWNLSMIIDGLPFYNSNMAKSSHFIINKTQIPSSNLNNYFPNSTSTQPLGLTSGLSDCDSLGTVAQYACYFATMIKNVVYILVVPSQDSIDSFKGLSTALSTRAPFAYAYDMNLMRKELFNSSLTASSTVAVSVKIIPGHAPSDITFLSQSMLSAVPYAGTVKIFIGWILWLMGAEYLYYRVIRVHDQTPQ